MSSIWPKRLSDSAYSLRLASGSFLLASCFARSSSASLSAFSVVAQPPSRVAARVMAASRKPALLVTESTGMETAPPRGLAKAADRVGQRGLFNTVMFCTPLPSTYSVTLPLTLPSMVGLATRITPLASCVTLV